MAENSQHKSSDSPWDPGAGDKVLSPFSAAWVPPASVSFFTHSPHDMEQLPRQVLA